MARIVRMRINPKRSKKPKRAKKRGPYARRNPAPKREAAVDDLFSGNRATREAAVKELVAASRSTSSSKSGKPRSRLASRPLRPSNVGAGRSTIRALVEYKNQLSPRWWTGGSFTNDRKAAKIFASRSAADHEMRSSVKRYATAFHRNARALEVYPA